MPPPASSCGRLFDAVAAALDVCAEKQSYEGQAATIVEHLAWRSEDGSAYPFRLEAGEINPSPLWPALGRDLKAGVPRETIARRFHNGLTRAFGQLIRQFGEILDCRTVVLSGGVFQNRLLLETMRDSLATMGFTVWIPEKIPMNDGGLSLGQAVVAVAQVGMATGDQ